MTRPECSLLDFSKIEEGDKKNSVCNVTFILLGLQTSMQLTNETLETRNGISMPRLVFPLNQGVHGTHSLYSEGPGAVSPSSVHLYLKLPCDTFLIIESTFL